ncbi:MAG: SRPBCC domain-containing protein [Myxococcales bacterium]|nr:SRPBCC domain-containing protein [Myxococcales bacterium]MCB9539424.1 SRPBCC domain-containing protein [Myxococcales bacterium]
MKYAVRTHIAAPPEKVWPLLVDGPGYPGWNPTVVKVEGDIALGGKIKVFAAISPDRAFPVRVTRFDAPRRMEWTGGMPLGLFKGVRTFTLEPADGGTDFAMEEAFSGLMKPLIAKSMPDLQPAFDDFAAALKARAEAT